MSKKNPARSRSRPLFLLASAKPFVPGSVALSDIKIIVAFRDTEALQLIFTHPPSVCN